MMPTITREQHELIFLHTMIFIESPECNDGSGQICDILRNNQIYTIIDTINLDPEKIKSIHKLMHDTKFKLYFNNTTALITFKTTTQNNIVKHYVSF